MATKKEREKRKITYSNARKVAEQQQSEGPSTLKLPEGLEWWKWKEGTALVNVVPWIVGDNNPRADKGECHYELTYFTHKNVGPENKRVVCPAATFKEPCPICEYMHKLARAGKLTKEERSELRPMERQVFVFQDINDEKKLKLCEGSHYNGFGEVLKDKCLGIDPESEDLNFHHLGTDGRRLRVSVRDEKTPFGTFPQAKNVEFERRKNPVDESILDEMPCIEDCLIKTDYDDLKKLYFGKAAVEEDDEDGTDEEEETPKKMGGKKEEPEEEEDDEDGTDEEEEEEESDFSEGDKVTTKFNGKKVTGTISRLYGDGERCDVKENGKVVAKSVKLSDCTLVEEEADEEEDELEEKPAAKKGGKKKPAKDDEEEDEDDPDSGWGDDGSEEEETEDEEEESDDDDWGTSDVDEEEETDDEETPPKKKNKR